MVDDPKLSKETGTVPKSKNKGNNSDDDGHIEDNEHESDDETTLKAKTDRIRDKLMKSTKSSEDKISETLVQQSDSDSDEYTNELERERKRKRQKKA